MRRNSIFFTQAVATALILSGCASASSARESSGPPSDAISQMEISFDGSPRQSVIREAMNKAFTAVGMSASEENQSRAGSTLVSFRKEYGISEMEILDCIPYRANDPRVPELNFPNVAAVCVTDLSSGVSVP